MRARLLLALALLTAPGLAGCIQGAQAATAQQTADPARDRAADWAEDAELASATGMEGRHGGQHEADYWDRAGDDEEVGDGRCKVWRYVFVADSKPDEAYVVALDDEGEVLEQQTQPRSEDDAALGDWSVDSDEALQIAKEANDDLAEGIDRDNYGLLMELERDSANENPAWFVAGGGAESGEAAGGYVVLDAVTGDVLETRGGSTSWDEQGRDYGPR